METKNKPPASHLLQGRKKSVKAKKEQSNGVNIPRIKGQQTPFEWLQKINSSLMEIKQLSMPKAKKKQSNGTNLPRRKVPRSDAPCQ